MKKDHFYTKNVFVLKKKIIYIIYAFSIFYTCTLIGLRQVCDQMTIDAQNLRSCLTFMLTKVFGIIKSTLEKHYTLILMMLKKDTKLLEFVELCTT